MLKATIVQSEDELNQIYYLNRQNLKQHLSNEERATEGFVTWLYELRLLKALHELAPGIIVKDKDKVVAYALTALPQARTFHPDLDIMFRYLESLEYKGHALLSYRFYCMGQICVDKNYRGKGLVQELYNKHKEIYSNKYQLLITEVSTANVRSQKAHEKVGFKTIHTYKDAMDEWNVVVWEW
ncbi:MAG TPA: GNAT family N-acetyltransferase [Flavisolibacter sp.]|nr:GNAT family N-acetyltransferase [Flavisolibacter sp.]